MQPDPSKIRALLKKTQHHDKDERFMATSDLASELEKVDGQLDSSLQTPIRDAILKQLDDPSNDVQSIACKCLCSIVQKFVCEQVEEIVDKLGSLLVNGKFELRDIYSIALKNIISSVPEDFGQQISKKLVRRLLQGLKKTKAKKDTEEEQKEEERNHFNRLIACLDIMKDLTARFGFMMADDHSSILETIQPLLSDPKVEIRKKVAISLGAIVGTVNDDLFNALMKQVIDVIKSVDFHDEKLFTFIQAVGIFARNAGQRVSVYLKDIVPLLIHICTDDKVTQDNSEAAIDLRENCLQTFDVMIIQCPKQMLEHTEDLMKVGLSLMTYDPNYDYGSTDDTNDPDTEMKDVNDNEDDDDFGDDDDWGDDDGGWDNDEKGDGTGDMVLEDIGDDDTSWKVRRAAVKMLTSFIQTHKSTVQQYHLKICESLLGRFKEHDTTVRLDIFTAFQELLLASIIAEQGTSSFVSQENNPFEMPPLVRQVSSFQLMSQKLPEMMQQICTQFKSKTADSKVKNGLLGILRDLVLVRQAERSIRCDVLPEDGIKAYFDELIPQIIICIQQNNDVQLKSRALYVLYLILQRHRNSDCLSILVDLSPAIISSVDANYPRVKTRAMLVVSRVTEIVRNDYGAYDAQSFNPIINELFSISFKQLSLKDIEGEVKKAALKAATACLSRFGDKLLSRQIKSTLSVLNERLNNEITRETSLECFGILASSPLHIDISSVVNGVISEAAGFLKKSSSSLRVTSATTLISIVCSKSGAISTVNDKLLLSLIAQCSGYINDSDLHLCALILQLITEIVKKAHEIDRGGHLLRAITQHTFVCCYKFLQSPLLQGNALDALKSLFASFYNITSGKMQSFSEFKNELIRCAVPKLSRSSYSAIAQCLSVLILSSSSSISDIISLIDSKNDAHSQVSLLAIGELGKSGEDLSGSDSNLEGKIFEAFNCESESVKWAASFALGNIAVGNMAKYVPSLIKMINNHSDRQYLLLNSLKEIITHYSSTKDTAKLLLPFSSTITPLLLTNASSNDEGVRAMIAECLGKFAVIDNATFSEIERLLAAKDVNTRATMATAIKYGLNKSNKYQLPQSVVTAFLATLSDSDLLVKRQTFLSINTMLRVNARLIIGELDSILPIIFAATITNQDLIREVDLGPFKHRVDDGLPLRKASFTCLDSLLDSTPHKVDLFEFVKYLKNGLIDESPDIQMLTYQIFYKVGTFHGAAIVGVLDTLPTDLMKGIKQKMNEAKGNKDSERAKDILRAACKALYTLRNVPNVNKARKFVTFYSRVEKTKILIPMLTELKNQAPKNSSN